MYFRALEKGELKVGMAVRLRFDTERDAAFNTCMVTGISEGVVYLARPHARVQEPFAKAKKQSLFMTYEDFYIYEEQAYKDLVVFTTGSSGTPDIRLTK